MAGYITRLSRSSGKTFLSHKGSASPAEFIFLTAWLLSEKERGFLIFTRFLFASHLTSPLPLLRFVSRSVCLSLILSHSCHCFLNLTFTICFEWEHCSLLFKGTLKSDVLPVSAQTQSYYSIHCRRVGTSAALNYLQNSPHTWTHTLRSAHICNAYVDLTHDAHAQTHGRGHPGISPRWKMVNDSSL